MSKYEKSNWIDNETVLKAEHMRKIEQGIVDLYNEIDELMYQLINGRTIDGGNLGDEGIRNIYDGGEL